MNNTPTITDAELRERLMKSFISPAQKNELESLISEMTNAEREELVALIEQSIEEANKADPKYRERLEKLNAEYEKKLKILEKETVKGAYAEAEKVEGGKEKNELNAMEGEIASISQSSRTRLNENLQPNFRQSHVIRNLILIFLLLIVAAGAALYVISVYGLM